MYPPSARKTQPTRLSGSRLQAVARMVRIYIRNSMKIRIQKQRNASGFVPPLLVIGSHGGTKGRGACGLGSKRGVARTGALAGGVLRAQP